MKSKIWFIIKISCLLLLFILVGRELLSKGDVLDRSRSEVLAQTPSGYDWPQLGRDPQRSNYTPEEVGNCGGG